MRYKIDNQELQDNEVKNWWNDDKTKKWHHFTYDEDNPFSHHLILRQKKVLQYLCSLNLPRGSKVLELGCGAGQTAKKICDLNFKYLGIDISKHLCEESERKCQNHVNQGIAKFVDQSMEQTFPAKDNEFDVCIIIGSIQYVGNLAFCFKEISRTLKKNGHIIVCQANMYPFVDIIFPRHLILKLIYFLFNEEFLISPSFKSMLCESKLGIFFKRYENSKFMNLNFMIKGTDNWKYKIRKRLYSYRRLKKLLNDFDFEIKKKTGATFFFPKKNMFYYFWFYIDKFLQFLLDKKIFSFLINLSDNLVILSKKK